MPTPLDLSLVPVARYAGRDAPELLGLYTAEPPRRTARGRGSDRLILYLAIIGNAPLPAGKQEQALADLAKLFYATPSSITAALRAVAEELNKLLLERNLRISSAGRQGMGFLTQVVVRDQQLFIGQSGLLHAFLISSSETQHFFDPEMSGRSLGQSRATPISYYQAALHANDTLLLAAQPASSWNITLLSGMHGQGPESLRRRLFGQGELDLNAVLIQAKPGKGKFYLPRAAAPTTKADQDVDITAGQTVQALEAPVGREAPVIPQAIPVLKVTSSGEGVGQALVEEPAVIQAPASGLVQAESIPFVQEEPTRDAGTVPVSLVESAPAARPSSRKRSSASIGAALGVIGKTFGDVFRGIGRGLRSLFSRLLPGEPFATLPSSTMAFIAVAVPIIIVTVASVAYFRLGRAAQYDILYTQAEQTAIQAIGQTDVMARRADWEKTLEFLNQAEAYRTTPETQTLRLQARGALDELELVRRVSYQPAIVGGLPAAINVTRIVVSDNDLYLLDGNGGSVLRARPTNLGYEIDHSFQCGSNVPGITLAGPLIDIAAWPAGYEPEAAVLALDSGGDLLFCAPDASPLVVGLSLPPSGSWVKLAGFALDLIDFYLLDPPASAVWVFLGGAFSETPSLFFDEEVPQSMVQMVDILADRDDLYLLQSDGLMLLCASGVPEVIPTRCSSVAYVDSRPGRENNTLASVAPFIQMQLAPPPDPSLFLLEPESQAIYQFSLRSLVFQRQYLPENSLPRREATAFAVNTLKRNLFLALGNEVFYAVTP